MRGRLATVATDVVAVVRIGHAADSQLSATISIRAGSALRERVLRDASCAALTHAAALVVALAIDPAARVSGSERAAASRAAGALGASTANGEDAPRTKGTDGLVPSQASSTRTASTSETSPDTVDAAAALAAQPSAASDAPPGAAINPPLQAREPPASTASGAEQAQRTAAERTEEPAPIGSEPEPEASTSLPTITHALPAAAANASDEPSALSLSFALGAGPEAGPLPGAGLDVRASLGVRGAWWRGSLRLDYAPPRRAVLTDPADVGGRVALVCGALDGGLSLRSGTLEVPVLLGLESGTLRVKGQGVGSSAAKNTLWLAAYLGSGVSIALSETIALGLQLQALLALRRPRFAAENRAAVGDTRVFFRPTELGGRAFLELEARFR